MEPPPPPNRPRRALAFFPALEKKEGRSSFLCSEGVNALASEFDLDPRARAKGESRRSQKSLGAFLQFVRQLAALSNNVINRRAEKEGRQVGRENAERWYERSKKKLPVKTSSSGLYQTWRGEGSCKVTHGREQDRSKGVVGRGVSGENGF